MDLLLYSYLAYTPYTPNTAYNPNAAYTAITFRICRKVFLFLESLILPQNQFSHHMRLFDCIAENAA